MGAQGGKSNILARSTIVAGRYRVVKRLGGGRFRLVYLVEDSRFAGRSCALIDILSALTGSEQRKASAAFRREAEVLAQLNNEHIPRTFDNFHKDNHHYLVMEYVEGRTLENELAHKGGRLDRETVIDISLQILDTLEYLHRLIPPLIFHDLQPSNVMVSSNGQVKLIDFGIARFFEPEPSSRHVWMQPDSMLYAPPEKYMGMVEARNDLFALGATMHQALSGRDPRMQPPHSFPPLKTLCPEIDTGLAAVVDRALAYEIPTAEDFKRELLEANTTSLQIVSEARFDNLSLTTMNQPIFVVHGHHGEARESVARFLEKLQLKPIVLHERPNKGRTLITKFREESAHVGFAIVLMTPDDHGAEAGQLSTRPRARQNVVFELGFFIGKLGPERVAALVKGDIEHPSDFDGVVYIDLDDAGGWKLKLVREMEAVGVKIDRDSLMRP